MISLCIFLHRNVKLSSPFVNILIGIGAILFYVVAIIFGIDEGLVASLTASAMCRLQIWLSCFAFTLVFGTVFAKTWRIYYIFRDILTRVKKKKVSLPPGAVGGMYPSSSTLYTVSTEVIIAKICMNTILYVYLTVLSKILLFNVKLHFMICFLYSQ